MRRSKLGVRVAKAKKARLSATEFEQANARLQAIKKEVGSQGMKYFPAMEKTLKTTLKFIPKQIIEKVLQKTGKTYGEYIQGIYSRVLFVPQSWFREMEQLTGHGSKNLRALFFNGHFILPANKARLTETVSFFLMHEFVHGFDMVSGIKRNSVSIEALAYSIQLFSYGEKAGAEAIKDYSPVGELYGDRKTGLETGREAAKAAIELKSKMGALTVEKFFHTLFTMGNIDSKRIGMLKRELLK
ncbi:MAG: hypothetical protein HN878_03020 [Candidatus Diapherotrites archaeon]|jgi:hypothetical protein|nr:hypothetical protein [Candidatus Diapherotrites archaeon]